MMRSAGSRAWALVVMLGMTALLIHLRGSTDRTPPSEPLADMPLTIGRWQGQDLSIAPSVLDVLGKGEFLNREYVPAAAPLTAGLPTALGTTAVETKAGDPAAAQADRTGAAAPAMPIGLFIGYFPIQRSGQSIHSPQNCLPGSGWNFDRSGITEFEAAGRPYRVGEYLISNGENRAEVLYWYRAQGQDIANDYSAKFHMVLNSVLHDRTDAALIRIMTPLRMGETQAEAHVRVLAFSRAVAPMLSTYVPD